MKIVTVNIPESYVDAINKLIGKDGLYPSRSELIRYAVKEYLIKELKMYKNLSRFNELTPEEVFGDIENNKIVRIPVERKDNKPVREFKTYKILKKLEIPTEQQKKNIEKEINKPWEYTKPKKFLKVFPKEINFNLIVSHLNELKEGESLNGKEIAVLIGYNSNNGYGNTLIRKINERIPNLINIKKIRRDGRGLSNKVFTLNKEVLAECL